MFATRRPWSELVAGMLKGDPELSGAYFAELRAMQSRETREREILKTGRRLHPGLTRAELLAPFALELDALHTPRQSCE